MFERDKAELRRPGKPYARIGFAAVRRMSSEIKENRFLEVTYANGDKEVLYFKDFNSREQTPRLGCGSQARRTSGPSTSARSSASLTSESRRCGTARRSCSTRR
jgi:hypothetical protein